MEVFDGPEMENKIAGEYRKVLQIGSVIELAIELIILGVVLALSYYFNWYHWIPWIIYGLIGVFIISFLWTVYFGSKFRVQYWRYYIDEEYVRLKFGKLTRTYQLIPMTKIQFVETNQGPILRKYRLYNLSIGTMGSDHTIPGLSEEVAFKLREEISVYAKVKEVES